MALEELRRIHRAHRITASVKQFWGFRFSEVVHITFVKLPFLLSAPCFISPWDVLAAPASALFGWKGVNLALPLCLSYNFVCNYQQPVFTRT